MGRKEKEWDGYYSDYLQRAAKRGISPNELIEEEWKAPGAKAAESFVLPYCDKNHVVLEIGCGLGRVSRFVAPNCRLLFCADILDVALREAEKALCAFHNVRFRKINGYDLAVFENGYFDLVYSFGAFFHFDFELVVRYFGEIRRVLKDAGICVLEFKHFKTQKDLERLLHEIDEKGIEKVESSRTKFRYVSLEMLKVLCDYYAFNIVNEDVTRFTFRKQ